MFSHISEILKQFTTGQRIFVLIQLLFFGVIIYLGPKYIEKFVPDYNELSGKMSEMNIRILEMEEEIVDKSNKLIENSKECTNKIVQREMEFISLLDDLESNVNRVRRNKLSMNQLSTVNRTPSPAPAPAPVSEGPDRMMIPSPSPPQRIIQHEIETVSEDMVLSKIKEFRKKISNE
jgi:hypothetical protein